MSEALGSLRIEIIDPVTEPLDRGTDEVASVLTQTAATQGWADSVADAWRVGLAHLRRMTRPLNRTVALGQRLGRLLHERSLQLRLDGKPRHASAVRQHVFVPFGPVVSRLEGLDRLLPSSRGITLELTSDFECLSSGVRRAEAALGLRGSWPRLPMSVRVESWWRDQSIVTVELRSHRRLRYPRRYYRAAHEAARVVVSELT